MHNVAGHEVESAIEARAGYLDRPVLIVLTLSTVFAGLVLGVLWLGYSSL